MTIKTKKIKLKISAAIDPENKIKMDNLINDYPEENYSRIINTSLSLSLEYVKKLIKNPLDLEEELLKRKLEDIKRIKIKNKK